jgi:hypothetical protein
MQNSKEGIFSEGSRTSSEMHLFASAKKRVSFRRRWKV